MGRFVGIYGSNGIFANREPSHSCDNPCHFVTLNVEKLDTLRHIGEATKTYVVDLPEKTCAGTDGATTYAREAHT